MARLDLENLEFDGWEMLDADIIWSSEAYCAEKLGMSVSTLEQKIKTKHDMTFQEYKHKKQELIRRNIMKKQYEVAMTGNVTMLIWLGKQWLNMSDRVEQVVTYKHSDLIKLVNDFESVTKAS